MGVNAAVMTTVAPEQERNEERELIRRVVRGDAEAFNRIVADYQKSVYRTALAIMRNDTDADTITQETFVQAWRKISRFEGRSSLETWLTRIAVNKARDELRRRHRFASKSSRPDGDASQLESLRDERPNAERRLLSREISNVIEEALVLLPPKQRTIFALRHFEQRGLDEIATILGIEPSTTRVHLHRATRKIREILDEYRKGSSL